MLGDIHVLPQNDLRYHTETRNCWCEPHLELFIDDDGHLLEDHEAVVVHNSADGRELIEKYWIN